MLQFKTSAFLSITVCGLLLLLASCDVFGSGDLDEGDSIPDKLGEPLVHDAPRWSPDGTRILYFDHGLVNYDPETGYRIHDPERAGIWVLDLETGETHKLLTAWEADWSPDGTSVVYDAGQIFTAQIEGDTIDTSTIVQLTPGGRNFFPEWSPDGEWIVHDRSLADEFGPSGLWIVRPDGSDWHYIGGGGTPTWHSDGRSVTAIIGVSATSIEKRFVRYYPFDAIPPDTLIPGKDANNMFPRYSPDGSKIAYRSNWRLWVMDADGTNKRQLTSDRADRPDWSPDGQRIVYAGPQYTLWVINADGTNNRQLTFRPELGPITYDSTVHSQLPGGTMNNP